MNSDSIISVIIPVYNVEDYLDICVKSVLCQTYRNLDIIIVDDGSTDRCSEICDTYARIDRRVRVIHQKNAGQGAARNRALDIVKGEYIAFLDSDDFWNLNFLEVMYEVIARTNSDIVVCNYRHVDERGDLRKGGPYSRIAEKEYSGIEAMKTALYWNEYGVAPWAKLFRASLWEEIRFKEDRIYEDLATTYLNYYLANKVVFHNEYLMNYRIRSCSDIHQPFHEKKSRILDSAEEIMLFAETKCPTVLGAARSRELASACFILFRINIREWKNHVSTVQRCKRIIKKDRRYVIADKEARFKTRMGAALSYLGFSVEWGIFSVIVDR